MTAPTLPRAVVRLDAAARAGGNRREDAEQLARSLLVREWPVQVLKVRVDAAGAHRVAGLVLSGVKFHGSVSEPEFLAEVAWLVQNAFTASDVEEVDVWSTVPIPVRKGAVVGGDYAEPTTRVVFSATVRRGDAGSAAALLRSGRGVFWDAAWRAGLGNPKEPDASR